MTLLSLQVPHARFSAFTFVALVFLFSLYLPRRDYFFFKFLRKCDQMTKISVHFFSLLWEKFP